VSDAHGIVPERGDAIRLISAHVRRRAVSAGIMNMKRTKNRTAVAHRSRADEALPEYDFRAARRNKYATRYAKGSIVVTLDPDVASVFAGAREVNEALRALARRMKKRRARRPPPRTA
jgi:hypothetical protein